VAEAFLGAEAGEHFVVGVETDSVAFHVPGRYFLTQISDAVGNGVAMVARIGERFFDLLDDLGVGWIGGVTHPKIDDVNTGDAELIFAFIDCAEEIRW
jgi:hypothetical protein